MPASTRSAMEIHIHMSHSLNSLKGGYIGDYIGDYYRGLLRGILGV